MSAANFRLYMKLHIIRVIFVNELVFSTIHIVTCISTGATCCTGPGKSNR